MFSDYFEKGLWKKTTNEEKKKVVKNSGTYFPANHSNKIKGIDELAEAVVDNAMKKQEEIVEDKPRKGFLWRNCEECGKKFESYRGIGKYCEECVPKKAAERKKKYQEKKGKEALFAKATHREKMNASKRASKRGTSYEYELMKIMKGIDPLRSPNGERKSAAESNKRSREENKKIMTPVGEATFRERETASKRAMIRGTVYLDELKRIIDGVEPIRTKVNSRYYEGEKPKKPAKTATKEDFKVLDNAVDDAVEKPVEKPEANDDLAYLDALSVAIDIVRTVKSTEDVQECIKKVCDIFRAQANKKED